MSQPTHPMLPMPPIIPMLPPHSKGADNIKWFRNSAEGALL